METVSENSPKRKRGRPRSFDAKTLSLASWVSGPGVHTSRSHQNRAYALRALSILEIPGGPHPYPHLFNGNANATSRKSKTKWGVLVEIGRIASTFGGETATIFAKVIEFEFAKAVPNVRDAERRLRKARLQEIPAYLEIMGELPTREAAERSLSAEAA